MTPDTAEPDGLHVSTDLTLPLDAVTETFALLAKRGAVHATGLRARPLAEKAAIVAQVREHVWPLIEAGAVRPIVDHTRPLEQAADAHRDLQASGHIGKVLLTLD